MRTRPIPWLGYTRRPGCGWRGGSSTGSPAEVAARLYADLHALDAAGYDRIVAALPPDADEWRAVRDRLSRAAAE